MGVVVLGCYYFGYDSGQGVCFVVCDVYVIQVFGFVLFVGDVFYQFCEVVFFDGVYGDVFGNYVYFLVVLVVKKVMVLFLGGLCLL